VPFSPGDHLGPYEIVEPIGKGGMGEVYRARDSRVGRDVAIKTSLEQFGERFEREARAIAALNHPNICTLFDVGTNYLVMELVSGPTLADRIAEGPIPVDEALPIARQIAEALEAAHEQGIIHRDLKPANIKLRLDGTVKVLDFGLAKAMEPGTGIGDRGSVSLSPTITSPALMTGVGMILGTAAYMSPEQARGKAVDRRADVWAFGCVLFEMLTGQRAFEDEDVSLTLSKVLRVDPAFDALPAAVPARVTQALKVCLQKDPRQRASDIHDVRLALEGAFETRATETASQAVLPPAPLWRRALPSVVSAAAMAVLLAAVAWAVWPSPARPVIRSAYRPPEGVSLEAEFRDAMAVAPDGAFVVYKSGDTFRIRSRDSLQERAIQVETPNFVGPYVSPDGQSLAYWTFGDANQTGQFRRVSLTGGSSVPIAPTPAGSIPYGASWEDGTILYGLTDGIWRVPDTGGEPTQVLSAMEGEVLYGPRLLPGGEWVLLTRATGTGAARLESASIVVQSLVTKERRTVVARGRDARYLPTGHLVYGDGGVLLAVPFDLDRLTAAGGPVPVVEGVKTAGVLQIGGTLGDITAPTVHYDVARDGTLVYVPGTAPTGEGAGYRLALLDAAGKLTALPAPPRDYAAPRASPDGTRIAVQVTEAVKGAPATHLFVVSRENGVLTQLTFDGTQNLLPLWTPDGTAVVYASNQKGSDGWGIYRKAANGSGVAEPIVTHTGLLYPLDVSKRGILLFAKARQSSTGAGQQAQGPQPGGLPNAADMIDLWAVPLDGSASPALFLENTVSRRLARFSPDGRWVAYVSGDSGTTEVYVRPYPRVSDTRWRVSDDGGGIDPIWAPDQTALYFIDPRTATGAPEIRAPIQTGATFTRGPLEALFQWVPAPERVGDFKDLMPDGRNFLAAVFATELSTTPGDEPQIVAVYNWFEELKRLAPSGR
jgi:serine/threonine-protein kinase